MQDGFMGCKGCGVLVKGKIEKGPVAIPVSPRWEASGTKVWNDHPLYDEMHTGKGFGEIPPPGPRQEI